MVEFPCEAMQSWTFVCWECFDYWFNFTTSDQSIQIICSFWFRLGRLYVSGNLSIFSTLSNLLVICCSSILMIFLYFYDIGCNFSSFISHFGYLFISVFSLISLLKIYQFCLPFQRTSSWFHWFLFFCLYVIYFCSDLYDFIPSTNFGFCLSFFF